MLGDHGVFIRGRSGAGKTALALELIGRASSSGLYARLVSDDQLFASKAGNRLIMSAPHSIAGMVEIYGMGVQPIVWQPRAVIDLVVTLVDAAEAERMPAATTIALHDVELSEMRLAERTHEAALAIMAHLRIGLFDAVHMRQNG